MNATCLMAPPAGGPVMAIMGHDPTPLCPRVDPSLWTSAALGLLCALLTWALGSVHLRFFSRPLRILKLLQDQGVQGHPFRPFVGQLPEIFQIQGQRDKDAAFAAATEGFQFFTDTMKKYGKTCTFCLGRNPSLLIMDPVLIQSVYVDNNDSFNKTAFFENIPLVQGGVLTSNGAPWKRTRRHLNPAFSHKEIKRIFPTVLQCSKDYMARLGESLKKNIGGGTVDADGFWNKLTVDVIVRSAFGSQIQEGHVASLVDVFVDYVHVLAISLYNDAVFPFTKCLPLHANRRKWALEKAITKSTQDIISDRLAKKRNDNNNSSGVKEGGETNLLDLMINTTEESTELNIKDKVSLAQSILKGPKSLGTPGLETHRQVKLSKEHLLANCVTFLITGSETTANVLTWATMLLGQHPEWKDRARKEVNSLCDKNGGELPGFEQLSELTIVQWIIWETLRLFPPAPCLDRIAVQSVKVSNNLTIPAGTTVVIPVADLQRSKEQWGDDADLFRPDRFSNGMSRASRHPKAFMPFSVGPRSCLAQSFAMGEAKILLATFLRKFDWKVSSQYRHHSVLALTLRPRHGMTLDLSPLP